MAAEAEAAEILLRIVMQGAEYCLRFTGAAAGKGAALCVAGLRTVWERERGKQKLGGKINARAFIDTFRSSAIFTLDTQDLEKLKPEMKRLHIPYMQYKSNEEMKQNGQVDISVPNEEAERFSRLAQKMGIDTVSYDVEVEELSPSAYELLTKKGNMPGVEATISPEGISVTENPTPAMADPGNLSAPNSARSSVPPIPFNPSAGIDQNLMSAQVEAARLDGRLIPLSINKETLLETVHYDTFGKVIGITVIVPGTKGKERLTIPRENIVSMNADGGHTIRADLDAGKYYRTTGPDGPRNTSGREIGSSGNWDLPQRTGREKVPQAGARPHVNAPRMKTPKGRW